MNKQELKDEIKRRLPIMGGIRQYTDIVLNKSNQFSCIWHSENTPSATIFPDQNNGHCYGCDKHFDLIDIVGEVRGLDFNNTLDFFTKELGINTEPNEKKKVIGRTIDKIYDYTDANNKLIYQAVRQIINYNDGTQGKGFFQRQPNEEGGWINNLKGIEPLPYQLPALLLGLDQGNDIYIVEGEKDVHTLRQMGLTATCNSGGAGHWKEVHSEYFPINTEVTILPDNDQPGQDHAVKVATQLHSRGCKVKVLDLPGLPIKGDVTDWLAMGHTAEELLDIVGKVGYWHPIETKTDNIPKIYGDWRDNYKKLSDYAISKSGQLCRIVTKKIEGVETKVPVPLSNFIARISKDVIKDDGQEQKLMFEIEGFLSNAKALPTITIESNKFTAMNWIIDNWGSGPILSPGGSCRDYLRHSIQQVSEYDKDYRTIFNYTGWRPINDKWTYLHGGGAIGAEDVIVDLSSEGNLSKYELPTIGNEIESARMALAFLNVADYKITVPLLALAYLTPLCEPLRQAGHEPDFVGWVQGMTQSMKSSLSAVLLNHFGKGFTKNTMPASFKDTYVYTDRKGFLLKDSLLVVDDFHPSTSKAEAQKMHSMAQKILRAWGDRIGRGRGNVDGTIRQTYPPRGMCLVTGEDLPEVGQSGMARYFLIKIKRGDINKAKLTELQNNTDLLAQNMANYINWLSPQIEDIAKVAGRGLGQLRDTFTQCQNLDGRMPETLAFLCLGLEMFLKYSESIGVITIDQRIEIFNNSQKALVELSCSHAENIKEEQPVNQFLKALNVMLETEQVEIINIGNIPKEGIITIGYREVDAECYYLIPDAVYSALVQFYNKQDAKFPVSKATLWQHLANDGHIECGKVNGKETPTKGKKIHGKNARYIHLKISSLEVKEEE